MPLTETETLALQAIVHRGRATPNGLRVSPKDIPGFTTFSFLTAQQITSLPGSRYVVGTANRIKVTDGGAGGTLAIDIDSAYAGQTSITNLGTVTTGTWHGSLITVQYGGTGVASVNAYGIIFGGTTTTGAFQSLAPSATTGTILRGGGSSALPSWSTATYPATAGSANNALVSDGTNWASVAVVNSVAGTTNQVSVSASTGAITLSLPSSLILPNGTTATTQSPSDNSTKVATTAYTDAAVAAGTSLNEYPNLMVTTANVALPANSNLIIDDFVEVGSGFMVDVGSAAFLDLNNNVQAPFDENCNLNVTVRDVAIKNSANLIIEDYLEVAPGCMVDVGWNSILSLLGATRPPTTRGAYSNLVTSQASNTTLSVSFDLVALWDGANAWPATNFSGTINAATLGPLGLDTGSLGVSTWYYIWVMSKVDGTGVTAFLSTSRTQAGINYTNLSGYSAACPARLIGTVVTNSSSQFKTYIQRGNRIDYGVAYSDTDCRILNGAHTSASYTPIETTFDNNPVNVLPVVATHMIAYVYVSNGSAASNVAFLKLSADNSDVYHEQDCATTAASSTTAPVAQSQITMPLYFLNSTNRFYWSSSTTSGHALYIYVVGFLINL